jgi:hypothetical protein
MSDAGSNNSEPRRQRFAFAAPQDRQFENGKRKTEQNGSGFPL